MNILLSIFVGENNIFRQTDILTFREYQLDGRHALDGDSPSFFPISPQSRIAKGLKRPLIKT